VKTDAEIVETLARVAREELRARGRSVDLRAFRVAVRAELSALGIVEPPDERQLDMFDPKGGSTS
jgi:hypothetical protein